MRDSLFPVADSSIRLLTVGFAFHWFDADIFLSEAERVLSAGGTLVIYNMVFRGDMLGNKTYSDWHKHVYIPEFATPKRNRSALKDLLKQADYGLELTNTLSLSFPLKFTTKGLRNYLTTQSNVAVALKQGRSLEDIDSWIDKGLAPLFNNQTESFHYTGQAAILKRF